MDLVSTNIQQNEQYVGINLHLVVCITFDDFQEKMNVLHLIAPSVKESWYVQKNLLLSMTFVPVVEDHCINPAVKNSYSPT